MSELCRLTLAFLHFGLLTLWPTRHRHSCLYNRHSFDTCSDFFLLKKYFLVYNCYFLNYNGPNPKLSNIDLYKWSRSDMRIFFLWLFCWHFNLLCVILWIFEVFIIYIIFYLLLFKYYTFILIIVSAMYHVLFLKIFYINVLCHVVSLSSFQCRCFLGTFKHFIIHKKKTSHWISEYVRSYVGCHGWRDEQTHLN